MTPSFRSLALLLAVALTPAASAAQETDTAQGMTSEQFAASLQWKTGDVTLGDGLATVRLPAGYRYLDPAETERVLVAWGNPAGEKTLGMIFPADRGPMDHGTWGVVVEYIDDGHVDDADAAAIDYDTLLTQLKARTHEENAERKKQGLATAELVGWAAKPHYDAATRKLYWAKELTFSDLDHNTINYDIRVLGARGVLQLNAVGGVAQLDTLATGMQEVLGFVDFTDGNRYADYKPGIDRKAEYGIAALVAGGLLAKSGLLKGLLVAVLAMKKLIIVGLAGIAGFFRKLFGRKGQPVAPAPPA